jgi:hypothetical protein
MSIGDKLREIDDEVRRKGIPVDDPLYKPPAQSSRETVINRERQQGGPRSRNSSEADEERRSER